MGTIMSRAVTGKCKCINIVGSVILRIKAQIQGSQVPQKGSEMKNMDQYDHSIVDISRIELQPNYEFSFDHTLDSLDVDQMINNKANEKFGLQQKSSEEEESLRTKNDQGQHKELSREESLKTRIFEKFSFEEFKSYGSELISNLEVEMKSNEEYEQIFPQPKCQFKSYRTIDKNHIPQIKFEFELQTTVEQYLDWLADEEQQLKFDQQLDIFKKIQGESDLGVYYMVYKRMFVIDPRDFLYFRYVEKTENGVISVQKSVDLLNIELPYSQLKNKMKRGEILLQGSVIKQTGPNKIKVEVYSECDYKNRLPPAMTKKAMSNEIQKSIERTQKHFTTINQNKNNDFQQNL